MKLYLDDIRLGPIYKPGALNIIDADNDWVIVRSVENAQQLIMTGLVTEMSLDHDMGPKALTGMDLVKWMVDTGHWPSGDIIVHSANIIGAENMMVLLSNAKKHGLRDT